MTAKHPTVFRISGSRDLRKILAAFFCLSQTALAVFSRALALAVAAVVVYDDINVNQQDWLFVSEAANNASNRKLFVKTYIGPMVFLP